MGKGEELHMELEFDRDVIHCWEIAADGTLCQEETLETIVPDACPDILRIVAVCGQATLNGKQAREGAAAVSGSVRAVLLYQPEEGGGLRRMEAALPFSAQLEAPGLTGRAGSTPASGSGGGGPGPESKKGAAPGRSGGGCDRFSAQGAGVLPGGAGTGGARGAAAGDGAGELSAGGCAGKTLYIFGAGQAERGAKGAGAAGRLPCRTAVR